jgi:hypothetical protein
LAALATREVQLVPSRIVVAPEKMLDLFFIFFLEQTACGIQQFTTGAQQ